MNIQHDNYDTLSGISKFDGKEITTSCCIIGPDISVDMYDISTFKRVAKSRIHNLQGHNNLSEIVDYFSLSVNDNLDISSTTVDDLFCINGLDLKALKKALNEAVDHVAGKLETGEISICDGSETIVIVYSSYSQNQLDHLTIWETHYLLDLLESSKILR